MIGIIMAITVIISIVVFKIYFSNDTNTLDLVYKEDFYKTEIASEKNIFRKIFGLMDEQVAMVMSPFSNDEIYISTKFQRQEHPVTCEVAALRMALNYFGENVTESELLAELNFDTKKPMSSNNTWGDPDVGFVGSVHGSVFNGTGYGVFEKPIQNLASKYREANIIKKADLSKVISEVNKRNPVIVWGLLSDRDPIYWKTEDGKTVEAYPGEHARVVIGYSGDISNPSKIILMDPIYGKIKMTKEKFLEDWNKMENRAVVIF